MVDGLVAKRTVLFHLLNLNLLMDLGQRPSGPTDLNPSYTALTPPSEQCYEMYGDHFCFSLRFPWVSPSRPVIKVPHSPEHIGTSFTLFTRLNQTFPAELDPSDLRTIVSAPFVPDRPFRVVVHGYFSHSGAAWVKMLVGELLRSRDQNVIVVDWSVGAIPPFTQAVANLRLVATQLAYLIHALSKFGDVPMSSFHLIGHSLGAHLSGAVGSHLRDTYGLTLPRITGLDPAEPYFNSTDPITRLDPSDADFVDVIHTNDLPILGFPLSIGMTEPIGHLDFYPNGGIQPGCSSGMQCNHNRAITYFTESIRQSCPHLAVACPSYQQFIDGECWGCEGEHRCSPMGISARPLPVAPLTKLYLDTKGRSPHCGYHYRVSVEISNSTEARDHLGEFAILHLRLNGNRDTTKPMTLSEQSYYYEAGTIQKKVVLTSDIGRLKSVGVYFEDLTWLLPRFNRRVYAKSITIEPMGKNYKWRLCFKTESQRLDRQYTLNVKDSVCN